MTSSGPAPDPVLSISGIDVDPTAAETVTLAADLVATMRVSPGCVGLAAPQVGVGERVFCVDVSTHPKARTHHGTFVLCNAEVVAASRNEPSNDPAPPTATSVAMVAIERVLLR